MKPLLMIFFLLFCTNSYGQHKVANQYSDNFGEKLHLFSDSVFKHTWHFDLASSWTEGSWYISEDTVYLMPTLIYDTLTIRNSKCEFLKDSLVLSADAYSSRIENVDYIMTLISGGGQYRRKPPCKLYLQNKKLFRIHDNGKLDRTKSEGVLTRKKYNTYFKPIK